ncbi:MAG TPA: hypothetical protein VND83_10180 [Acidimicrobiales bacterium]|nr:hypothetical protein [Acidimicrobiales bacterium]
MAAVEILESDSLREWTEPPRLYLVETTPSAPRRVGPPLAARRAARARMLQRRRRTIAALALVGAVTFLAWPGTALGGVTGAGLPTDLAGSSTLASGEVYVVQPGDSVTSIATLMNPLSPHVARAALVHELGTAVVVPGEHVLIP